MESIRKRTIFKNKIISFWNTIWQNKWYPFLLLSIIYTIILVIIIAIPAYYGGFLHINSDDLIQYYPYINGFFDKLKSNSFSLYEKNLFGGVSFFSSLYYVPLDIFTLFAFLLSYFIEAESAYAIFNFLRVVFGALLLYYTFQRKFSYKVSFIASLILFVSGLTEAYYIFPVYLGIIFYAPLGILIVDLVIEKKNIYFLLLPIYSFIVILYDFYIAYMLLAFVALYFVVSLHINNKFSFFRLKNNFIKNKESWLMFLEFIFLLLLGVLMAGFIILPSLLYILNETARNSSLTVRDAIIQFFKNDSKIESYRYFSKSVNGIYKFSFRHYFTQLMNLFIPNNPHQFCLVEAGDYVREHASLYLTIGGFVYLIYFFTLSGKKENRLKGWVIFFNLLLLIPIFSIIFCLNTNPYVRWFFIPYFFNLYAMSLSMDKDSFKVSQNRFIKYIPLAILLIGFTITLYVLLYDPKIFIHYNKNDSYFYLILIPTIIFISVYIIVFLFAISKEIIKGRTKIYYKLLPFLIFLEFIFAAFIIFSSVENTTPRYYTAKNQNQEKLNTLKEIYPYSDKLPYRINLYTVYGRETANLNIQLSNVNFGRFFQSFYNKELRVCLSDLYNDKYYDSNWSFNFKNGYSLISSPYFNVKYIISNENINLPEKYYDLKEVSDTKYYSLKDDIPFIVYEEGFNSTLAMDDLDTELAAIRFIYLPDENVDNFPIKNEVAINFELMKYKSSKQLSYLSKIKNYYVYNLDEISDSFYKDAIYVAMSSSKIKRLTHGYMYLSYDEVTENTNFKELDALHYNTYYQDMKDYKYLLVEGKDDNTNTSAKLYTYSFNVYDDFITTQNNYKNKSLVINKDTISIKCQMPEENKLRIIKTGYAYSKEWVINDNNYKTCNVGGGFLGILVDSNIKDVNVTLRFKPDGFDLGTLIALVSSGTYLGILLIAFTIIIIKKKRVIK